MQWQTCRAKRNGVEFIRFHKSQNEHLNMRMGLARYANRDIS